ncbi:hypothetical protein I6F26_23835 [Ensifer sp. IC3342]|nr:hypothetical protein [Ensifer sp. BRP08]MCA1449612.1 hypothetical protein [Ensifer sp. IC3342]
MAEAAYSGVGPPARSVRYRLLAIALLPMLVILQLLLGVTVYRWDTKFDATLISKVNADLTIAHQYLARILENTGEHITALAGSARFRDVVGNGRPALTELLGDSRKQLDLDFLYIVSSDGILLASSSGETGMRLRTDWPIIHAAIDGRPATAIDIFDPEDLRRLSPALAERARLALVPTPNARPTDKSEERRGMVVQSASPILLGDGNRAILVGGMLLNQNLLFIDTINDLVYRASGM